MTVLKKNILFYMLSGLFVLVAITTYLLSGIYAKYVTTANGADSARVAKFDVGTNGGMLETSYAVELDPITDQTITDALTLANSSEVAVECSLSVDSVANLPLVFNWKVDGETYSAKVDEAAVIVFEPSTTEKDFDLEISWDESEESKSFIYRRQVDKLILNIDCVQID